MMIFQSCITSVASFLRFLTFSSISVHSWWSPKTEKMSGVLPYLSRTFRDDSSKYFNIFCNLTWSPKMAALCKTLNCGGLTWTIWISFPCLLQFSVGLFFFTKFVLPKWINQNKLKCRCPDNKAAFPIICTLPELTLRNMSGLSVVWLQVGNLSTNVPFRGGGKGDMTLTDSSSFSPSSLSTFKNGATVIRLARAIFNSTLFMFWVWSSVSLGYRGVCAETLLLKADWAPETHWKFINGFRTLGGDKYFLMRIFMIKQLDDKSDNFRN